VWAYIVSGAFALVGLAVLLLALLVAGLGGGALSLFIIAFALACFVVAVALAAVTRAIARDEALARDRRPTSR